MEQVTKIILHPKVEIEYCGPMALQYMKSPNRRLMPSTRSKNIVHTPGFLCSPYGHIVTGTQGRIARLERRLKNHHGNSWESRLHAWVEDLDLKMELDRVACFYDEAGQYCCRLEHLPWMVIANHDPDMPGSHVARELNKMCKHGYMVASTAIYHSGRKTRYRFYDQHDASLAKLFFS